MSLWGPLAARYEDNTHKPRRILALDGGGIRGVLTLAILAEIEKQLRPPGKAGDAFRLCDFFDYIGGTSTGAIIAAGLARGMSVAELTTFYIEVGPSMFEKAALVERWRHFYSADPLAKQLRKVFGPKTTLSPADLRCLLLVVTRNATTDSPWPISSNPLARYNDVDRKDCNLAIPLWQLVRASTAAPIFFPPEVVRWDPKDPSKAFAFVDGGMTPYNNPAFLMYRMVTSPAYRLDWPTGEDKMMIVSVGTGAAPNVGGSAEDPESNLASTLKGLPSALMGAASVDQDTNCRTIGRCVGGAPLDRELGDLIPRDGAGSVLPLTAPLGRAFLYARYNADLSTEGLARLGLDDVDPAEVSRLDAVPQIPTLRKIGRLVAKRDVRMADFGTLLKG